MYGALAVQSTNNVATTTTTISILLAQQEIAAIAKIDLIGNHKSYADYMYLGAIHKLLYTANHDLSL